MKANKRKQQSFDALLKELMEVTHNKPSFESLLFVMKEVLCLREQVWEIFKTQKYASIHKAIWIIKEVPELKDIAYQFATNKAIHYLDDFDSLIIGLPEFRQRAWDHYLSCCLFGETSLYVLLNVMLAVPEFCHKMWQEYLTDSYCRHDRYRSSGDRKRNDDAKFLLTIIKEIPEYRQIAFQRFVERFGKTRELDDIAITIPELRSQIKEVLQTDIFEDDVIAKIRKELQGD
jgi:hypothetical protein